jgi:hypothetical protein
LATSGAHDTQHASTAGPGVGAPSIAVTIMSRKSTFDEKARRRSTRPSTEYWRSSMRRAAVRARAGSLQEKEKKHSFAKSPRLESHPRSPIFLSTFPIRDLYPRAKKTSRHSLYRKPYRSHFDFSFPEVFFLKVPSGKPPEISDFVTICSVVIYDVKYLPMRDRRNPQNFQEQNPGILTFRWFKSLWQARLVSSTRRAARSQRRAHVLRGMAFKPRRVSVELRKVGTPGCAAQRGWRLHEVPTIRKHYYYASGQRGCLHCSPVQAER